MWLSLWWLYVIVGYLTLWAMIDFYRTVMPASLDASGIGIRVGQLAAGREAVKRHVLTAGQNTANSRSSQSSRTRPSRARSAT
jgi:hypothetical protein